MTARPQFRNPAARDRAWGRYFARCGARPVERVTGRVPSVPPTNNERRGRWAGWFYSLPETFRGMTRQAVAVEWRR